MKKRWLVSGMTVVQILAEDAEEAKTIARETFDLDVRGSPEEVAEWPNKNTHAKAG